MPCPLAHYHTGIVEGDSGNRGKQEELKAGGYRLVGESWGGRPRWPTLNGPPVHHAARVRARAAGVPIRGLGPSYAEALYALGEAKHTDYPFTPATAHELRGPAATRAR